MLKLGGKRSVLGDRSPAVRKDLNVETASINHRLNREKHAFLKDFALTAPGQKIVASTGFVPVK